MSGFFKKMNQINETYLIAEIGINHNGDINIAKKLIDAANACGWQCAKFQKRNPDKCVPEHQKHVKRDTPWGEMSYIDYKYKVEFDKDEYDYIDKYCKQNPLSWTVSVWDIDSLNFIGNYDVPFIKNPSAHITNKELLTETAKSNIPIIIRWKYWILSNNNNSLEAIVKYIPEEINVNQNIIVYADSSLPIDFIIV